MGTSCWIGSQVALAGHIGLAPTHNGDSFEQPCLKKWILCNQGFGLGTGVQVNDIDSAPLVGAIVFKFGAAGQQQVLVAVEKRQMLIADVFTQLLMTGFVPGLDQLGHDVASR